MGSLEMEHVVSRHSLYRFEDTDVVVAGHVAVVVPVEGLALVVPVREDAYGGRHESG